MDQRHIRALQVENSRLGERLKMLEVAIEEKANAVEAVATEVAALRKETRALEKKLSKLPVKRSQQGSSQATLQQLQQQIDAQAARNEDLLKVGLGSDGLAGWLAVVLFVVVVLGLVVMSFAISRLGPE